MGGGTEAFPELGRHCQHPECHQLDFLPFKCEGCRQVFCLEHRTYKSHNCSNSNHNSRKVVVCEICSASIETTGRGEEDVRTLLEEHEKSSDCDPLKKKKPTCAVGRCKEKLTFSNTCVCKTCQLKVCLKHRFPADHGCKKSASTSVPIVANWRPGDKFLAALASRNAKDCTRSGSGQHSTTPTGTPSISVH